MIFKFFIDQLFDSPYDMWMVGGGGGDDVRILFESTLVPPNPRSRRDRPRTGS